MSNPLDLDIKNRLVKYSVEKLTGLGVLKGWYDLWLAQKEDGREYSAQDFIDFTLGQLNVSLDIKNKQRLKEIPTTGPVVIVANHPLGGLEGMLLAQEILKYRPDLKVLTNELLLSFPEFNDLFIGVDILNENTQQANGKGIRTLTRHLSKAGAVLIFPAGTVSNLNIRDFSIQDKEWHDMVGRLGVKYKATCIPMYINARNRWSFYLSEYIHRRIRTALLAKAMIHKKNSKIELHVGHAIQHDELKNFNGPKLVTQYLRLCSELLNTKPHTKAINKLKNSNIKENVHHAALAKQMEALSEYRVQSHGDLSVYCAPFEKLGCVMEQIAICRERTFRTVDEGTGKELDSDRYDPFYSHIWIWNEQQQEVVGGYRIAKVDEIIKNTGIENVYSRSLYQYEDQFIKQLGKSVEVGRSFIIPEYQRHPRSLDLLWKAIGAFIVDNPQYYTLFGCVSISKQYSLLAKTFLSDTLNHNFSANIDIKNQVQSSHPLPSSKRLWNNQLLESLSEIPIINKLLGRIDSGKSLPILIKHYLALNGKFISFSVNHEFNQSLDGLIMVDLREAPDRYINRYLGSQEAEIFKKNWSKCNDAA